MQINIKKSFVTIMFCAFAAMSVTAQENPFIKWNKMAYAQIKAIVLRSAEKMPEEHYSFKPTDDVRSFGQIIGHLADSQYTFCSIAVGEKRPNIGIEKSKTSKADLIEALKSSFAYCDKAFNGLTDATAVQNVKLFGMDVPRLSVFTSNSVHSIEHYGNLVTYMRLKGVVPPTSETAFRPGASQ
jgi:uncharacterized damage-inducible protein DinB